MLHQDQHPVSPSSPSEEVPARHTSDVFLDAIEQLYDDGLYLQAYERSKEAGPLHTWSGERSAILAGRLAVNLGHRRLCSVMHQQAFRRYPKSAEAAYYYIYSRLEQSGPLRAWLRMKELGDWPDATPKQRADWLTLKAQVASLFRDYQRVDELLKQAEALSPINPWYCVVQSYVLETADRHDEAMDWAKRGLELKPWNRPNVLQMANLYNLRGREGEAIEFLLESVKHNESASMHGYVARLILDEAYFDLKALERTRFHLDEYVARSPMLDKVEMQWVHVVSSQIYYLQGNDEQFFQHAEKVKSKLWEETLLPRLRTVSTGKRVLLPVPFIRQHHSTCGPATLAMLAQFWKREDIEHLKVAADICYDGITNHAERHWAETNQWYAREFTVTRESAFALLDAGIPFTLTTIEPGAGHLQAVVGYDERRNTLLIRDPSFPGITEMALDKGLERYAAFGPRGLALVPLDKKEQLAAITLPDEPLYDVVYKMERALNAHNRQAAQEEFETLVAQAPEHRLVSWARRQLGTYDDNPTEMLAANEQLLKLSPDNTPLRIASLSTMGGLVHRDERIARLHEYTNDADADPIFGQMLASEVMTNAGQEALAERLLMRAIRTRPHLASAYMTLADLYWTGQKREQALELYRMGACISDKQESYARSYFNAAQFLRETPTVLAWMEEKEKQWGGQSCQPAETLFWAYDQLNRTVEGFAVLERALTKRPEDGQLLLYIAEAWQRRGNIEKAREFQTRAEGKVSRARWLRSRASLEDTQGNLKEALKLWEELLTIEPLAADGYRMATRLRAEILGRDKAIEALADAIAKYPHHYGLRALQLEWLGESPDKAMDAAEEMQARYPDDSWLLRELAKLHLGKNQGDEALAAASEACRLDPSNPASPAIRGSVLEKLGRQVEASDSYWTAIQLDVDYPYAPRMFVSLGQTRAERRGRLKQYLCELHRQHTLGGGISTYYELAATGDLEAEELLTDLEGLWQKRQDLWLAWSCVIAQQVEVAIQTEQTDPKYQTRLRRAHALAKEASEKFPLLPDVWVDLARVQRVDGDEPGEIASLEQARQLNPNFSQAIRLLAHAYVRQGRKQEAQACLENAVERLPLDPDVHDRLAEYHLSLENHTEAIACCKKAIEVSPGYERAWAKLRFLANVTEQPTLAIDMARELANNRPLEARSWLMLADVLDGPDHVDEKLDALDQAILLNPTNADFYDKKAETLAQAGRFSEALAVCEQLSPVPNNIRGRRAWILWQQGEHNEAIARMEQLLKDDPGYEWAAWQLVQWLEKDPSKAEKYAYWSEAFTKISPRVVTAYGHWGDALVKLGKRDAAKEVYRRGLQLDSEYTYAGNALFDLHWEDGETAEAGKVVKQLTDADRDPFVQARLVQAAAHGKSFDDIAQIKKSLVLLSQHSPEDNPWPMEHAVDSLWKADFKELTCSTLVEALDQPEAKPFAANMLIRAVGLSEGYEPAAKILKQLQSKTSEVAHQGYMGFIEYLNLLKEQYFTDRFVRDHEEKLREHTLLWARVGGLFCNHEDKKFPDGQTGYYHTVRWLEDYESREDGEQWMLLNYAFSAIGIGRWDKAEAASRHALTWQPDRFLHYHRIWLAIHELLAGNLPQVSRELADVDRSVLDNIHAYFFEATQAANDTLEKSLTLRQFGDRLREAAKTHSPIDTDRAVLRAVRDKLIRHVARERGGWSSWFAVHGQLANQTVPTRGTKEAERYVITSGGFNMTWPVFVVIGIVYAVIRFGCASGGGSPRGFNLPPPPPPVIYTIPSMPRKSGVAMPSSSLYEQLRKEMQKQ